ncbi:c-type cytochrome [Riemerella columbipharyngis]|uniref:Cytochrome c oxidase cbb3-type subunit 3 n=1 Tax=Riemerella columbipharyngis TaxID=1071918 RepID=A0A1G7E5B0_9FLAO|nr:c-type cytochrome [Riemerella columbipharyngis]SDE58863.1 cytochrome c oxidase cbb3-type subunit 3 [Riemerella columbipharyngis]
MKQRTPVFLNIVAVLIVMNVLYYMFVQSSAYLKSPYFWGTVVISIVLVFIHNAIGDLIENQQFEKLSDEEKKLYLEQKKIPFYKRAWDSAFKKQAVAEEKDLLIDHGFDGIMELDNQLPKWWLGMFYFGFAYLIIYIVAFSFTPFAHPDKEYEEEHKQEMASIAEWIKNTPPPTLETAKYSADNIADGKQIFEENCVKCHMDGGKGGIGPNLTDKYWINHPEKTLFKSVFEIVENGVPGTAMPAWGKDGMLNGFDIQKVAAYVYHINQEQAPITPEQGGAPAQGEEVTWEK